jgi:hypothetical protein
MNHLTEFDKLLSNETITTDSWYDFLEEVAKSKIKEFDDAEWEELSRVWKLRSEDWQIKLAGVLGSYNPGKTVPLLENMVKESDVKVVSEALNSLEGMDGYEYLYVPGEEMLKHLDSIYSFIENPIHKNTIASLQSRANK